MTYPPKPKRGETTVDEALAAWEQKGPTSLTVALMADALYGIRDERLSKEEYEKHICRKCLHAKHEPLEICEHGCKEGCVGWDS